MGIDFVVIWADDFNNVIGQGSPLPAVTPKFQENNRYIVLGVDVGVIWAADFDDVIRFHVHRLTGRLRVTRRPPTH